MTDVTLDSLVAQLRHITRLLHQLRDDEVRFRRLLAYRALRNEVADHEVRIRRLEDREG